MRVRCIDDCVDGITLDKAYNVKAIFIRENYIQYGVIDDYGVYNEYNSARFEIVNAGGLEFTVNVDDVLISMRL